MTDPCNKTTRVTYDLEDQMDALFYLQSFVGDVVNLAGRGLLVQVPADEYERAVVTLARSRLQEKDAVQ